MKKLTDEMIEKITDALQRKCNGYELPLSLNVDRVVEIVAKELLDYEGSDIHADGKTDALEFARYLQAKNFFKNKEPGVIPYCYETMEFEKSPDRSPDNNTPQASEDKGLTDEMTTICACKYAGPCQHGCSCANPFMSAGCLNCATYGSEEQKIAMAKDIMTRLTPTPPQEKDTTKI